jgi:hypothetical protein
MEQICYRKGDYKYTLLHDWECSTGVTFERDVEVEGGWVRLLRDGTMYIRKDYHWDGPSGPAIDTQNFMRGSLVHDGFYQMLRDGIFGESGGKQWQRYRKASDKLLRAMCKQDGMSYFRRAWVYRALRWFGGAAAEGPGETVKVRCAPAGCDVRRCAEPAADSA